MLQKHNLLLNITYKMQITYLMIKNLFSNLKVLPSIQKKNNNSKK